MAGGFGGWVPTSSPGGASTAADVSVTDAGGYFTSTDVEGALQELGAGGSDASIDNAATFDAVLGADLGYDEEFTATGSTLPTGWSWVNQGTTTYSEAFGAGTLSHAGEGSETTRAIVHTVPTETSWTLTTKVAWAIGSNNYASAGLLLRDGTSGSAVWFRVINDGTWYVTRPGVANHAIRIVRGVGGAAAYLRLRRNSATSYDFLISPDGLAWAPIISAFNVSAYFTPTQIGLLLNAANSTSGALSCHWWRIR